MLLITQGGLCAINMEKVISLHVRSANYSEDTAPGARITVRLFEDEEMNVGFFSFEAQAIFEADKIINAWANGVNKLVVAEDTKSDCAHRIVCAVEDDDEDDYTEDGSKPETDDLLLKGIEWLDLPTRAYNALRRHGINTVSDLVGKTEGQLGNIRNLGKIGVCEIVAALRLNSLGLKEDEDGV